MQSINRVTLVLKSKDGETLADLLPHIHLGVLVAIGTGVAVIASATDRDAFETHLVTKSSVSIPASRKLPPCSTLVTYSSA
jgi:hypothetical protein